MGREEDVIWKFVKKVPVPGTDAPGSKPKFRGKCQYCTYFPEAVANATRATDHLLFHCKGCPDQVKAAVKLAHPHLTPQKSSKQRSFTAAFEMDDDDVDDDLSINSNASSSSTLVNSPSPASGRSMKSPSPSPSPTPRKKSRDSLWAHIDNMTEAEQAKHEANFARAIYATRCPNNLFEHPLWISAFKGLRPSFDPPQGAQVGGRLLNSEYDNVMEAAQKKIKEAPVVGVTSDGWKNIRGEGLLNFAITTPEPVFYKVIEVKDEKEGGEFIAKESCNVIDEIGEKKVTFVVTDNCLANKVAWDIVEEKYPHISAVGDPAHVLNLLDCTQFKSFDKMEKMSRVLVNGIRLYRRPLAYFKKEQLRIYGKKGRSLKNYSKTRFSGTLTRFKSVLCNKNALQSTVIEGTTQKKPLPNSENFGKFYINPKTKQVALDDAYYWERLPAWISVMEPIASALADLEGDQVVLSDVPAAFYDIKNKCIAALEEHDFLRKLIPGFKRIIQERKEFIIKDVHSAANLLDPRYKGSHLTRDEKLAASEFIARLCDALGYSSMQKEEVLSNLTEFRAEAGLWARESVKNSWRSVTPSVWWRGVCGEEPLCPIAIRLLSVPGSSAATERNWSCFARTHTKGRNRLLNRKTEKLVAVQMNLKYSLPPDMLSKGKKKKRPERKLGPLFPQGHGSDDEGDADVVQVHEEDMEEESESESEGEDGSYEDLRGSDEDMTDEEWDDLTDQEDDDHDLGFDMDLWNQPNANALPRRQETRQSTRSTRSSAVPEASASTSEADQPRRSTRHRSR